MTIEQSPAEFFGAYDKAIFRLSDTQTLQPKYRYVLQLTYNSTVIATMKALPNANSEGVFDIGPILADQMTADVVMEVDEVTYAANMSGNLVVTAGYEFAADADSAPTTTLTSATSTHIVLAGSFVKPWMDSNIDAASSYLFVGTGQRYIALTTLPQKSYVSGIVDLTNPIKVQSKDYATITVIEELTANFGNLRCVEYDADGTELADTTLNVSVAAIGCYHIPVGPDNINVTLNANTKLYRVGYELGSILRYVLFEIEEECKHPVVRVAWWNQLGGIDYYNFYAASSESRQVENYSYRTYGGNFLTAGSTTDAEVLASEGVYSGGRTKVTRTLTANTGYISEAFVPAIMDLIQSPQVWVVYQNQWQAAIVKNTRETVQTSLIDKTINYEVQFEFAKYGNAVG